MEGYHRSVLLREAVDALIPTRLRQDGLTSAGRGAWYLDCTLGDGGHSIEIIKRGGRVVGIDVDPEALERVRKRFQDEGIERDRFRLVQGNFREIEDIIKKQTEIKDQNLAGAKSNLAGAIFDLGVSSLQLESPERGFSFAKAGPLDMRMDPRLAVKAMDLVNNLSGKELYGLFHNLGEEKYSKQLAATLVSARQVKLLETTTELAGLVVRVIGPHLAKASRGKGIRDKIHPATRIFQAIRIAVNDELNALKEGLEQVKDAVEKDSRIVVISFHSLEDRIVKHTFRKWQLAGFGQIVTKKPIMPSETEITENPRSRSAKMRVFEKR